MRIMVLFTLIILLPMMPLLSQEETVAPKKEERDVAISEQIVDQSSDDLQKQAARPSEEFSEQSEGQKPVEQKKQYGPVENADGSAEKAPEQAAQPKVAPEEQLSVEKPETKLIQPSAPEQETLTGKVDVVEEEPELVGIDTVSLEDAQGNWLFKRIWWERAEERYGKIRELVNNIWESRTTFFMQRSELDKKVLDPFYLALGMGQGELQTILSELDEFFTQEREKQGELSEQERTLYQTLEEEQESLRLLKTDVESISNLDQAVDDALGTLMDQINKARQLEKQAWEYFKEIAHVLNDIKARELYYMMDGAGRNIKNISFYLEKDFTNHFGRLIAEAKKHTTRVLDQIKSLKEKGVDFKRQVDRLAQQEEQERLDKAAQEEQEQAEVKPKPKKQGWGDWALSLPGAVWDSVSSSFSSLYNKLFSSKNSTK